MLHMFLTTKQVIIATLFSIGFWCNGVLLVRVISSHDWWKGIPGAGIFVVSIPIAIITIMAVRRMLALTAIQLLPTIVLITAIVTLMHGLVLSLLPSLYSSSDSMLTSASAWLLWFAGVVLVASICMKGSKNKPE